MARAIDWSHYDQLKAQGLADRVIARQWGIPWGTFHRAKQQRKSGPPAHSRTPTNRQRHTQVHPSTPMPQPTRVHRSTPYLPATRSAPVHPSTPAEPSTQAPPSVPLPNDLAVRLLSLLPDLEVIVARERDRQRLLSTPVGTPRHTMKKTYVVDTLYVDLIERYAQAEGVELKDVVNLAFHEFFERRDYLPGDTP
jgi:hypothetical protein